LHHLKRCLLRLQLLTASNGRARAAAAKTLWWRHQFQLEAAELQVCGSIQTCNE
jgi:hypothetical protein